MKTIRSCILSIVLVTSASAGTFDFIKAGEMYKISFGIGSVNVCVISDAGGGWFQCASGGDISYVNFNQMLEISKVDPLASLASLTRKSPSPASVQPKQKAEPPPPPPLSGEEKIARITKNLDDIYLLAQSYFRVLNVKEIKASVLLGNTPGKLSLKSYDGEDYSTLVVKDGEPVSITTASGMVVSYRPQSARGLKRSE